MTDRRVGEKRHRAGRRPSPVWTFFTEIRTFDNKVHARCNFCAKRCAGVAARMRSHVLNKCENSPTDIERLLDKAVANSTTGHTTVPDTAVIATDAYPTPVVEPDTAAIPDAVTIQTSAVAVDTVLSPPAKRLKQTQIQHVQPPVEMENSPAATQEVGVDPDSEESEDEVAKDDDVVVARVYDQQVTQSKYSEDDAARVHQKLVLACVLNDVPAAFVEDKALMEAFNLARPGLPRLSAEQAKTRVLQDLADEAAKEMERSLASCKVFTLVHRHFKKQGSGDAGSLAKWCNQWIGVDEHRNVVPLKEVYREAQTSSPNGSCCRYCVPREEFDAVVAKYSLSLAPEAVFSLCSECPRLYQQLRLEQQQALSTPLQDTHSTSEIAARTKTHVLLSTCMLRQSLILRKELLSAFPTVVDLISKGILLAHSISKITPFRQKLEVLLELSSWDAVPRIVKCMMHLEGDVRRYQEKVSVPADEIASFWDNLRLVDKILTPFDWMLALSNAKETTSAQFIVLWLWLLAVVKSTSSSLLPEKDKESFVSAVMSLIGRQVDSHELVCMLLDPRISGVGLSISGKRRVKSLVVKVAERVFSSEGFESGAARSQLLSQLGDYTEKSGVFDDIVAWELSAGRPPRLFWNDFVEDTPHLACVARAVISVSPCAQTASESLDPLSRTEEFAWEQTFTVLQLKYQAKKTSSQTGGNVDNYRSLLFPPAPLEQGSISDGILSVEVDKALRVSSTGSPRWFANDETEVEARVMNLLSSMLKVGGDEEKEQAQDVPTARSDPLCPGISWFAFQSANDLKALEQAVKNFLPCPPTVKTI